MLPALCLLYVLLHSFAKRFFSVIYSRFGWVSNDFIFLFSFLLLFLCMSVSFTLGLRRFTTVTRSDWTVCVQWALRIIIINETRFRLADSKLACILHAIYSVWATITRHCYHNNITLTIDDRNEYEEEEEVKNTRNF